MIRPLEVLLRSLAGIITVFLFLSLSPLKLAAAGVGLVLTLGPDQLGPVTRTEMAEGVVRFALECAPELLASLA